MTVTITLPNAIEKSLLKQAKKQRLSPEVLALKILEDALVRSGELEEVVARIQAFPPNPNSIRSATESLLDLLQNAPDDPEFDLAEWQEGWTAVESEMKEMSHANSVAEGRGG
ncbi:MAG: hypothetical protein H6658_16855 [Ardenticatenaceae bacterium]|nr:hypothetical protein [Ardenticatenaceae bacterium]